MRDWFASLSQRDRRVLVGGVVGAALIVFWGFLWRPLATGTTDLRAGVLVKQRLWADMQRVDSSATPTTSQTRAPEAQSLVVLVDRTHREQGLAGALTRNQPDGADGIRVTFQAASFDALVRWLSTLQLNYSVRVESASFTGARDPGVVSATLVLRRS
jgi:general secretion pathway protein M